MEDLNLKELEGGVEKEDRNFKESLKREISEEAGTKANVDIRKFLFARTEEVFDLHKNINKFWIILSYIGVLESGELQVMEPSKNLGYETYSINEVDVKELTQCANSAFIKIKENWKEIENIIL